MFLYGNGILLEASIWPQRVSMLCLYNEQGQSGGWQNEQSGESICWTDRTLHLNMDEAVCL